MTATDISTTESRTKLPKANKPGRLSPAVRKAVQLLASGECTTQKAAAERCGISPVWLCIQLKKPATQVFLANESRQNIRQAQLRASRRYVELIDADSEHVSAQVSERILTSEGILKSDQRSIAVNVDVRAGFVLDLREDQAGAHTAHIRDIEAKPLIQQDDSRQVDNERDD